MNKYLPLLTISYLFYSVAFAQPNSTTTKADVWSTNGGWTAKPFDRQVFIQNKGQFNKLVKANASILYSAQLGDYLYAYFTTNGIIYRYIDYPKATAAQGKKQAGTDPDENLKPATMLYLTSTFEGYNPAVRVDAQERQSDYYSYPTGINTSVQVGVFKKITYHNLYQGIDAVFTFPKNKKGFEYALIVHPGANLSQVKLQYTGARKISLNSNGNVIIESKVGQIIDHAPMSYYQQGRKINATYTLKGSVESFSISGVDKTKTLVIDPWTWTSSPVLATNNAYDCDFDNAGNVYIYGGSSPYQLVKFNSLGVKLWTYVATPLNYISSFGGFCCDRLSGKTFCIEGCNPSGIHIVSVSPAGAQTGIVVTTPQLMEGWHLLWNACNDKMIIGGGSWQTPCVAGGWVDTNLVVSQINVLNESATAQGHDIALACYDPAGTYAYMATTQAALDPTNFNNVMVQLPTPALTPPTYYSATGYGFTEANVPNYIVGASSNALNGMAASTNWLYIYNGAIVKRVNKNTGVINTTLTVSGTAQSWGGLDVDYCDNLYVGDDNTIKVYNSALALTNTYTTSGVVFDLKLGNGYSHLYACGVGFVSSMVLTPPVCVHGAVCNVIVLPVELTYFNCRQAGNGIQLNWSTASETNNKYFTLQRSSDDINYTTIATINGAGNSTLTSNYTYTDLSPMNGVNYYRLAQTDFDGNTRTFNTTACNAYAGMGNVYPNPTPGMFTVTVNSSVSALRVYNVLGQKVYGKEKSQDMGNTMQIDLSAQPAGIYMLNIVQSNGSILVKKVAVSR